MVAVRLLIGIRMLLRVVVRRWLLMLRIMLLLLLLLLSDGRCIEGEPLRRGSDWRMLHSASL